MLSAESSNRAKKASSVGAELAHRLSSSNDVADPLGDVDGMVAEPLVEPGHQHGLQGVRQGDPALAQLVHEGVVELVELAVGGVEVGASAAASVPAHVGGIARHRRRADAAHLLDGRACRGQAQGQPGVRPRWAMLGQPPLRSSFGTTRSTTR